MASSLRFASQQRWTPIVGSSYAALIADDQIRRTWISVLSGFVTIGIAVFGAVVTEPIYMAANSGSSFQPLPRHVASEVSAVTLWVIGVVALMVFSSIWIIRRARRYWRTQRNRALAARVIIVASGGPILAALVYFGIVIVTGWGSEVS